MKACPDHLVPSFGRPESQPIRFAAAVRFVPKTERLRYHQGSPGAPSDATPTHPSLRVLGVSRLNLRRTSTLAILLVVVLRMAIGWQLLYEGMWKIKSLHGPSPWTSAGYLKNSQGPLRNLYRSMAGDPNELDWLNVDLMSSKWKRWQKRFAAHYRLTDKQRSRLEEIVSGPKAFYSDAGKLPSLPSDVDLNEFTFRRGDTRVPYVEYDQEKQRLVVDGVQHLDGKTYAKILAMVPENDTGENASNFREQLHKVYLRSSRLSALEKLRATVDGDPEMVNKMTADKRIDRMGEVQKYRYMIDDYESLLAAADEEYQYDHLKKKFTDLQSQRAKLTGPVKAIESDMKSAGEALLSVEQIRSGGKLSDPISALRISDRLTILGLTILGFCLICGLLTRFSAVMAAIMLFSFYLAMPPLPGLPPAPGPEHSLIVNKNLIEVIALLAIAAFPSGYWFGFDKFVARLWRRRRRDIAADG